ncbi:tumor protein p53-inducible protein 11-like isoform X2 [Asterias rubens]|uniref:tumor protein p53-inducible protein 11-like isoform X2 n=1 Tax=Asterias rubens TaxID=7604 RepID=UPI00145588CD|nr:tumor protein p53-inducible protein 11-like isoform X2 [Asterias rubens]
MAGTYCNVMVKDDSHSAAQHYSEEMINVSYEIKETGMCVKQSSGDLQSRLKTRKLLGVGECEDGSVPVSKISQILGNDDHYLLTLPNGLRLWQVASALVFSAVALLAIMFPVPLFDGIFASNCGPDAILPIRLFGAALSCLGLLFWSAVKSVSRYIIRWTLLSQVLYLSIQATVMMCTLCGSLSFNFPSVLVLLVVVMAITISLYFYAILSGFSAKWLWKPKMIIYDMPVDKNE